MLLEGARGGRGVVAKVDGVLNSIWDAKGLASLPYERLRAVGAGEEGDGVEGFDFGAAGGEAVLDLKETTGIAGGDNGRARGSDVVEFALEKFIRHFGLDQVVDARAAAAPHRLGQRHDVEAGNRIKQSARLRGDFLAVAKMAGVVIGDTGVGR